MAAVIGLYRNPLPPAELCVTQLTDAGGAAIALPLQAGRDLTSDHVLSVRHRFAATRGARPLAVYVGHTSPFEQVRINQRDLTPEIDLARRDLRRLGPRIYPIPDDALVDGENLLSLSLPVSFRLGETRIGQVCVGDARVLRRVWAANWWRHVGIPAICFAVFVVLGMIATTLSQLHRELGIWRWYTACVVLAACRPFYLLIDVMPGGPVYWRAASDLSILLFIFAMHRLLLLFWNIPPRRWNTAALVGLIIVRVAMLLADINARQNLEALYWLCAAAIAFGLFADINLRARHAPLIERNSLRWALGFAIGCSVLETIASSLFPRYDLRQIYPLGVMLLGVTLGFLLVRRVTTGARLLSQATRALGARIDDMLPTGRTTSMRMWSRVSGELADSERQRMLDVIEEGFGARMLAVLSRMREENPDSRLSDEIRRALLDLRLMVDAIDDACQSVGGAFATLRQRMQAPLDAAGLASRWSVTGAVDQHVGSRRKLTELFRCVEELLSNVIQHARADEVRVSACVEASSIVLVVEDDGCGLAQPSDMGRGLRNLRLRMCTLDGTFSIQSRVDGAGTRAEVRLPRI